MEKKKGAAFIKNSRQMGIYFCCIKEFFNRLLLLLLASLVVCTLLPVAGFQALEASVILFIV
jgi:hypothetical protein